MFLLVIVQGIIHRRNVFRVRINKSFYCIKISVEVKIPFLTVHSLIETLPTHLELQLKIKISQINYISRFAFRQGDFFPIVPYKNFFLIFSIDSLFQWVFRLIKIECITGC